MFIKVFSDKDHKESIKLYSKSNQFKISSNDDNFSNDAKSLYFEIFRNNSEKIGICSAVTYIILDDAIYLINWAISCRFFLVGVEEYVLLHIHKNTNKNRLIINYQESHYNQKVKEMLENIVVRIHTLNTKVNV